MREVDRPGRRAALDAIEQARERRRRDRRLLRLAHLRRRHHLHGLGDLRRAADRLDAPAELAGEAMCSDLWQLSLPRLLELVGRGLQLGRQLVAQRLLLCRSSRAAPTFCVVRKSVQAAWNSLIRSTGTSSM